MTVSITIVEHWGTYKPGDSYAAADNAAAKALIAAGVATGAGIVGAVSQQHKVLTFASGAAITIPNPNDYDVSLINMRNNGATALTWPNLAAGQRWRIYALQGSGGTGTFTYPASTKWPAGAAPTLTTTANKIDGLEFACIDGTNVLARLINLNYA